MTIEPSDRTTSRTSPIPVVKLPSSGRNLQERRSEAHGGHACRDASGQNDPASRPYWSDRDLTRTLCGWPSQGCAQGAPGPLRLCRRRLNGGCQPQSTLRTQLRPRELVLPSSAWWPNRRRSRQSPGLPMTSSSHSPPLLCDVYARDFPPRPKILISSRTPFAIYFSTVFSLILRRWATSFWDSPSIRLRIRVSRHNCGNCASASATARISLRNSRRSSALASGIGMLNVSRFSHDVIEITRIWRT